MINDKTNLLGDFAEELEKECSRQNADFSRLTERDMRSMYKDVREDNKRSLEDAVANVPRTASVNGKRPNRSTSSLLLSIPVLEKLKLFRAVNSFYPIEAAGFREAGSARMEELVQSMPAVYDPSSKDGRKAIVDVLDAAADRADREKRKGARAVLFPVSEYIIYQILNRNPWDKNSFVSDFAGHMRNFRHTVPARSFKTVPTSALPVSQYYADMFLNGKKPIPSETSGKTGSIRTHNILRQLLGVLAVSCAGRRITDRNTAISSMLTSLAGKHGVWAPTSMNGNYMVQIEPAKLIMTSVIFAVIPATEFCVNALDALSGLRSAIKNTHGFTDPKSVWKHLIRMLMFPVISLTVTEHPSELFGFAEVFSHRCIG